MTVRLGASHTTAFVFGSRPLEPADVVRNLCEIAASTVIITLLFGWSSLVKLRLIPLAALIVVATTALAAVQSLAYRRVIRLELEAERVAGLFHGALLDVMILLGVAYAVQIFDQNRRRELSESRLETELARAQVQLLRAQMQPHFLFNALNAIAGRITSAPAEAQRMVTRLGQLLRMSLETISGPSTSLREDLAFAMAYLDLQQFRFGPRLHVAVDVPAEMGGVSVPSFLLQPIVENSVRHAVEETDDDVEIGIRARVEDGKLAIRVWNSGPALAASRVAGMGTRNTEQRLQRMHGDAARISIRNRGGGGVETLIELPCVPAA